MFIQLLKSKIHRATVTGTNLNYAGSITVDSSLMEATGLIQNERVQVCNLTNGQRFETYVIEGQAGTGVVEINGAAAHLCSAGDIVIVMSFAYLSPEEAAEFLPRVVLVDERNRPSEFSF